MTAIRQIACALVVGTLAPCCAGRLPEAPLQEVEGGWDLGLQIDQYWTHMKVRPPYMIGPEHSLHFSKGRLHGNLGGGLADVTVDRERATGWVGGRPVEIDIVQGDGEVDLEGLWSGAALRLRATDDRIRASIPVGGACCREYVLERTNLSDRSPGFVVYLGDRRHHFYGARLEIPNILHRYFTAPELAVVLVALMSV